MISARTAKVLASRLVAVPALAMALVALYMPPAQAATTLSATVTPLTSTADRMISYREESHSWQSPDGAFHLLINAGNQTTGDALRLYTTADQGATWNLGPTLASTDKFSTSDGFLRGYTLAVVYSTTDNTIEFASFVWDPVAGAWSASNTQTVFASDTQTAVNPCLSRDSLGNVWVAYTATDTATGDNSIGMMVRPAGSSTWTDTGLTFGTVDSGTDVERSGRPVMIPGGMGMVYTVHDNVYWATRSNSDALDAPWTSQLIYARTGGNNDPYASHFSMTSDDNGNVNLVTVDGGRLLFMRYNASKATWAQRWLSSDDIQAGYAQVSMVGDMIVVASNVKTNAGVMTSTDSGQTFTYAFSLQHPVQTPDVSYRYPRLETAASSTSPILLFQQYSDNGVQRLLQYTVPVRPVSPSN